MNEQWNKALDQVEDEFLMEAARYRRKRYWHGVAAAAAAVLALAVGWSVLRPEPMPQSPVTDGVSATEPPKNQSSVPPAPPADAVAPGSDAGGGFWDWLTGGSSPSEQTPTYGGVPPEPPKEEEPPYYETLRFVSYEELQSACLDRQKWYLHQDVMIPWMDGQPLKIEDITVFEQECFGQPWVWYYASHAPYLTVRVPTTSTLTEVLDPNTSGSQALKQIWPNTPNLHNKEEFAELYSEIREVQITTAEGVKTALLRRSTAWDKTELIFLQSGTLVMIVGNASAVEGAWLETFSLVPIDNFSSPVTE
jgi:hypothetical protein